MASCGRRRQPEGRTPACLADALPFLRGAEPLAAQPLLELK